MSCSESELGKPEVDFSVVATLAAIVMCTGKLEVDYSGRITS